jgi:hypothetical protein
MFAIDATVAGLRTRWKVAQYQDSYRLCYVRVRPEGIIVAPAEQLS